MRRFSIALNIILVGVIAAGLLGPGIATGGPGRQFVNLAAPAFTPMTHSTHNSAQSAVCGNQVNLDEGGENRGDLDSANGSFVANVRLPQGATIKRMKLFVNDNSDEDVHVFLIRKKLKGGMPHLKGYRVMAKVKSKGAVNARMRKFGTGNIKVPKINNKRFYYFLEMVVCDFIEPHAVQIVYTR